MASFLKTEFPHSFHILKIFGKMWEWNKSDFCLFKVSGHAVSRYNFIQAVNKKNFA
jgi:hypothetical protein